MTSFPAVTFGELFNQPPQVKAKDPGINNFVQSGPPSSPSLTSCFQSGRQSETPQSPASSVISMKPEGIASGETENAKQAASNKGLESDASRRCLGSPKLLPELQKKEVSTQSLKDTSAAADAVNVAVCPSQASGENDTAGHEPSIDALLAKKNNAVITQFDYRGSKGRRLTFLVQEVPDVLMKGVGDKFIEESQRFCGTDILPEDIPSEDEEWTPALLQSSFPRVSSPATDIELEELVTKELLAANDETDVLYRLDSLGASSPRSPTRERKSLPQLSESQSASGNVGKGEMDLESSGDHLETPRNGPKKATMNALELRLWFLRVQQSYKRGVKVIKVSKKGKKLVRTIRVSENFLGLSCPAQAERQCHLSCIKNIKLGFASQAFHVLLDITPENNLVPPHQACVEVVLPFQSLSLIFPSEQARNEFLLLLRVLVQLSKRTHGDNSSVPRTA